MRLFALDPGSTRSGWCIYSPTDRRVLHSGDDDNRKVLEIMDSPPASYDVLVVEWFASHGQASMGAASMCDQAVRHSDWTLVRKAAQMARTGATATGDMCTAAVWLGCFLRAAGTDPEHVAKLTRKDVLKVFHCPSKGSDSYIRGELIRMHGGDAAIGLKKSPGPLYGVKGDAWQAVAVAVAWWELNRKTLEAVALAGEVM